MTDRIASPDPDRACPWTPRAASLRPAGPPAGRSGFPLPSVSGVRLRGFGIPGFRLSGFSLFPVFPLAGAALCAAFLAMPARQAAAESPPAPVAGQAGDAETMAAGTETAEIPDGFPDVRPGETEPVFSESGRLIGFAVTDSKIVVIAEGRSVENSPDAPVIGHIDRIGVIRMKREAPSPGDMISVTGFHVDAGKAASVLASGPGAVIARALGYDISGTVSAWLEASLESVETDGTGNFALASVMQRGAKDMLSVAGTARAVETGAPQGQPFRPVRLSLDITPGAALLDAGKKLGAMPERAVKGALAAAFVIAWKWTPDMAGQAADAFAALVLNGTPLRLTAEKPDGTPFSPDDIKDFLVIEPVPEGEAPRLPVP